MFQVQYWYCMYIQTNSQYMNIDSPFSDGFNTACKDCNLFWVQILYSGTFFIEMMNASKKILFCGLEVLYGELVVPTVCFFLSWAHD